MQNIGINERLSKYIPLWVLLICIIQPILDVLSYAVTYLGISNVFTLGLRMLVLVCVMLTAFIISKNKKVYLILVSTILLYTVLHIIACSYSGYSNPISDIVNLIRIFQMPCVTVCLITFVKNSPEAYSSLKKGLIISFLIIVSVEVLSVITATNPYTYENKQIGIIGWFNDSSAQSAILSAVIPIVIALLSKRYHNKLLVLAPLTIVISAVLYLYATRLAYITLLITLLGLLITACFKGKEALNQIISFSVALVLFVVLIPFSPMTKNQELVGENAVKKQEHIDSLISEYELKAKEEGLEGKEYDIARLEGAYGEYLGPMVHRFGLEETVERYSYSENASDICDVRLMKNTFCSMLLEEQGVMSLLFGMELDDMAFENVIFDSENDFHGIFYLTGIFGILMIAAFILFFSALILKALIKDFRNVFTIENCGIAISFISLILHIYATCGVLRRPSASIYLSIVFAMIFNQVLVINKKGHKNAH